MQRLLLSQILRWRCSGGPGQGQKRKEREAVRDRTTRWENTQNRGENYSQPGRQSIGIGRQERGGEERKGKGREARERGPYDPRKGRCYAGHVSWAWLPVSCSFQGCLWEQHLGREPLSEAWEKQIREWVRRDRGGEAAPTGSQGIRGEGSRGARGRAGTRGHVRLREDSLSRLAPGALGEPSYHLHERALPSSRLRLPPWPA